MDISKIDKNFIVEAKAGEDCVFYDCLSEPFRVYGLIRREDGFWRLPPDVAAATSKAVLSLSEACAGGRVRFVTDSPEISVRAKLRHLCKMPHFTTAGSLGMDLYADGEFYETFLPKYDAGEDFEGKINLKSRKEREIMIHMPQYTGVVTLEIGLVPGSTLKAAGDYRVTKPVVFYGSSITQGACASRPGNSYQNMLSQKLGFDYINLGFSGAGKAEPAIAEYIAGLDMSVFVYDYDHNAPDPAYLAETHPRMFNTFRAKHPDTPVVMMTKPYGRTDWKERRDIIRGTYERAKAAGDNNVYFIDTREWTTKIGGWAGTVDACHPNDLGFYAMASALEPVLSELLK